MISRPISNLGRVSLLLCFVALSACDFDEPISETPSREIDPQLLGTWQRGPDRFIITKGNRAVYNITGILERSGRSGKREKIEGLMWHTAVGTSDFLILHTGYKILPYRYLTYRIKGDVAIVKPVQARGTKGTKFTEDTQGSVIDRINRHKNDKDFFAKEEVYTRIK